MEELIHCVIKTCCWHILALSTLQSPILVSRGLLFYNPPSLAVPSTQVLKLWLNCSTVWGVLLCCQLAASHWLSWGHSASDRRLFQAPNSIPPLQGPKNTVALADLCPHPQWQKGTSTLLNPHCSFHPAMLLWWLVHASVVCTERTQLTYCKMGLCHPSAWHTLVSLHNNKDQFHPELAKLSVYLTACTRRSGSMVHWVDLLKAPVTKDIRENPEEKCCLNGQRAAPAPPDGVIVPEQSSGSSLWGIIVFRAVFPLDTSQTNSVYRLPNEGNTKLHLFSSGKPCAPVKHSQTNLTPRSL